MISSEHTSADINNMSAKGMSDKRLIHVLIRVRNLSTSTNNPWSPMKITNVFLINEVGSNPCGCREIPRDHMVQKERNVGGKTPKVRIDQGKQKNLLFDPPGNRDPVLLFHFSTQKVFSFGANNQITHEESHFSTLAQRSQPVGRGPLLIRGLFTTGPHECLADIFSPIFCSAILVFNPDV